MPLAKTYCQKGSEHNLVLLLDALLSQRLEKNKVLPGKLWQNFWEMIYWPLGSNASCSRVWLCHGEEEEPPWPTGAPTGPWTLAAVSVKWHCLPCQWGGAPRVFYRLQPFGPPQISGPVPERKNWQRQHESLRVEMSVSEYLGEGRLEIPQSWEEGKVEK